MTPCIRPATVASQSVGRPSDLGQPGSLDQRLQHRLPVRPGVRNDQAGQDDPGQRGNHQ